MSQGPGSVGSLGLLLLRLGFGGMMAFGHGLGKLMGYEKMKEGFADPMGLIDMPYALMALIGAEFFCAICIMIGLLTRLTAIPLVYAMGVAAFVVHKAGPIFMGPGADGPKEPALVYLIAFAVLILTGPGIFSIDHALFGKRQDRPIVD